MNIEHFLLNKFNAFSIEELSGGYTHQTYLIHSRNAKFVVKVFVDGTVGTAGNEAISNQFLDQINFKYKPKLIEEFKLDNKDIVVFEYIESSNTFALTETLDISISIDYFKQLGSIVAKIHDIGFSHYSNIKFNYEFILPNKLKELAEDLQIKSKMILSQIEPIDSNNFRLVHGDLGPQNSIVTKINNEVLLIDFEQMHWGNIYEDLGWFYWITILHFPDQYKLLLKAFEETYLANQNFKIDYNQVKAFAIRKIWSVLPEKLIESEETKIAWIERLRKALESDFNPNN